VTCPVRVADAGDADVVGLLLHEFNREFGVPTPGPGVLAERLRALLGGEGVLALLAGEPPVGVALLTFRPSVWFPGPAATLEELYVVPARRRAGIGGRLLDRVLVEATARGAGTLEIPVDEGDADARRFYEAHGLFHVDPQSGDGRLLYGRDLEP
jgi:GNAT superfamily N-acetyltransferase